MISKSNLRKGLLFEKWLLDNVFVRHKKNPRKYDIDLIKPGFPGVEAKLESCKRAKLENGEQKYLAVQLFVAKTTGPLKLSGPWKSFEEDHSSLYVVGKKKGNGYKFLMITTSIELLKACEDYMPGGPKHTPENLLFFDSQKIVALVPLADLQHINRDVNWALDFVYRDRD